jgi:hypothetical protein
MDVRWDPLKAARNLRKHGVRFCDAEAVLYDSHALTIEDPDAADEARYISVGQGTGGQLLVVVYVYREDHVRLISARRATRREMASYEKRI